MNFEQISVIEHEVEARLLEAILQDRQIPHHLRSYHDLAYDGLFQASLGWGAIYAEDKHRAEILAILADLRNEF